MVVKSRRSAAATGRGSSSAVGTMWSESRRSSAMARGQRAELRPSNRTKRRGDAASTLAGIQLAEAQGSRPSSCFSVSRVRSSDAAGAEASALRQIVRTCPRSSVSPASSAASIPWDSRSMMAASAEPGSFPFGQSAAHSPSIARFQASTDVSGISAGRMRGQPSGRSANGPGLVRSSVFSRRIRVWERPRSRTSASAAAACPSRLAVTLTPCTKCRSRQASARRARRWSS